MKTAVALIIFNRPEATARVLAEVAKAKPLRLFVIADGPRVDQPGEPERCAAARAVLDRVDWDCEVLKNYSEVNLGCGRRPATGISWVFEQVEEAIILEDDCVPNPTFFRFCEEILERYRHDERVMHVGGNNFQFGKQRGEFSYYFSCHNICWGWASWRRAWRHFDMDLTLWPEFRNTSWLMDVVEDPQAAGIWERVFDRAYERHGDVDYWDHQWTFACWAQNALSVLPNRTLISNIGFGDSASHTKSVRDKRAYLRTEAMTFPLQHPRYVVRNRAADRFVIENLLLRKSSRLRSVIQKLYRGCSAIVTRFPFLNSRRAISKVHEGCLSGVPRSRGTLDT